MGRLYEQVFDKLHYFNAEALEMESIRRHYPEPPVATDELVLKGLGVRELMGPGTVRRSSGADSFLFVCFLSGASDKGPKGLTSIPAGSLFVWRPFAPHDFGDPSANWNHSWLLACGSIVESGLEGNGIPCGRPLRIPAAPLFEKSLLELYAEVSNHSHPDPAYARNIVQNMLIDLGRLLDLGQDDVRVPEEYLELRAFIEGNFRRRLTLAALARRVGRSPQRLSTRFKELFGVSPIEHVIRLRLAEASALLQNRNLQVKDIASATGFESTQYFCRLFRRRYGVSPSQARAPRRGS